MNASYAWLKAFVPFELTPAELRDLLTSRCATVDEVVRLRADLGDIVVARVTEVTRHPNSDHLWFTKVDAGGGDAPLEVICGAPVVKEGSLYPFAPVGATLPGGLRIERRKIRGIASNGMLCSGRELGLSDDHAGILELQIDAAPGAPFIEAAGIGDTRLVVDVGPNRPDLLSHLGLAREIAGATGLALTLPTLPTLPGVAGEGEREPTRPDSGGAPGQPVRVRLDDVAGCPRYAGVMIRGVTVAPSPAWLAERLTAVGGRPINNIVDATNYLLHELGQPMHAFDAAKLEGGEVVVRRALPGERLRTLDGIERQLTPEMTVIADVVRAHALGGIIGGADAEVTDATTDIFLEAATFDPAATRRTRRALGLTTDASYRFERGTDVELPPVALGRAIALVTSLAGGVVAEPPVDLYPAPREREPLSLRVSRSTRVLGEEVCAPDITLLLSSVGFVAVAAPGDNVLRVAVPSWRSDVRAEVDLIEEIARLRGYDTFGDSLRPFRPSSMAEPALETITRRTRETLVSAGLLEARPMPFVRGAESGFVRVANPLAESEAYLRRDLLDTLARRAEHNLARMERDIRLFEVGAVFTPSGLALPREEVRAAALVMGARRPAHFSEPRPPNYDAWDAKALAESLVRAAYGGDRRVALDPGEEDLLWSISVDGTRRGEVRRVTLDAPVWAAPAFGIELTIQRVTADAVAAPGSSDYASAGAPPVSTRSAGATYRDLPTTPASSVDVSLLVPDDLPVRRVEEAIRKAGGALLTETTLLSEYRGEQVASGYRSVAWRLTFRHPERTLESKEVEGRRSKILRTLEGELGVGQRPS